MSRTPIICVVAEIVLIEEPAEEFLNYLVENSEYEVSWEYPIPEMTAIYGKDNTLFIYGSVISDYGPFNPKLLDTELIKLATFILEKFPTTHKDDTVYTTLSYW